MSYESPVSRGERGGVWDGVWRWFYSILMTLEVVMISSLNGLLNNFDFLTYKF